MQTEKTYHAAIIGGGLAGLATAIQLADAGYDVILFEKEKYPFHRVCGEYISFESWNFLEELGVPLSDMQLPHITKLLVSSPGGKMIDQSLPFGGFGISRYFLDSLMAKIARRKGVELLEETKVNDVVYHDGFFSVETAAGVYKALACCGGFGKKSNLDVQWKRGFVLHKPNKLNNYIGVKYHITCDFPQDSIALHNFDNGYCGISKVEDNKYCLCYLTVAENLSRCGNSIPEMERRILCQNPHLKKIFSTAKFLLPEPVTIAQISFEKKSLIENHILMAGDAAGMITPLCGNGMSMALHAAKIAFLQMQQFLEGQLTREQMEKQYILQWNAAFAARMKTGRIIQYFFGKPSLTNLFISTMKPFPSLINKLIRKTHGAAY
jgi:menaquinone-9 beta-reductase